MYLQANPGKGRTQAEKEELSRTYKPGDVVIPKIAARDHDSGDDEDRRMVEEVREMSLRELGVGSHERRRGQGTRERSREHREVESRHGRRRRNEGATSSTSNNVQSRNRGSSQSRAQARQIEHQSSLRSLLSASDVDSSEIEEEILRQIVDEGLLDGIDLARLDVAEEDELSERIAEAYRRRQRERATAHEARSPDQSSRRTRGASRDQQSSARRHHSRSHSAAGEPAEASRRPRGYQNSSEADTTASSSRRRTFSDGRRDTSPGSTRYRRASTDIQSQAAHSATELSSRPRSSQGSQQSPFGLSTRGRTSTEPERRRPSSTWRRAAALTFPATAQPRSRTNQPPEPATAEQRQHMQRMTRAIGSVPSASSTAPSGAAAVLPGLAAPNSSQPSPLLETPLQVHNGALALGRSSSPVRPRNRSSLYPEPAISCERCGKTHIEYDLHEWCGKCKDGNYNLCLRCYRLGLGCLNWFGFGYTAWSWYERQAPLGGYMSGFPLPHALIGHRYIKPKQTALESATDGGERRLTAENPVERLQSGVFCDICLTYANECFWKCDWCNKGEWGFCNRCVNQGKCCTHPLLPVAHKSTVRFGAFKDGQDSTIHTMSAPAFTPIAASIVPGAASSGDFRPLTFSTKCDICRYPIQPSNTRFHCPQCNEGDYDICTNCYLKLVLSERISKENGDKGWRRCLRGHRMVVVGFQDGDIGQRRVVVKDLVGGHALKDERAEGAATVNFSWQEGRERQSRTVSKQVAPGITAGEVSPLLARFPPDGGVGMRVLALWSYYPAEGATDELTFPRGAEIGEVEDINGDWFWGCYAGAKGVFPENHVRILDNVTM